MTTEPTESTDLEHALRPIELDAGALAFFELPKLAAELREREEYRRSGVSALTLTRDGHATVVLAVLRRGAVMREHRAPSAATVVVLSGRVTFVTGSQRRELAPCSLAAFAADVPHAVEALEDSAYLVTIGGRDRPHAGT